MGPPYFSVKNIKIHFIFIHFFYKQESLILRNIWRVVPEFDSETLLLNLQIDAVS